MNIHYLNPNQEKKGNLSLFGSINVWGKSIEFAILVFT
jgi:hypothetical protein